MIEYYWFFIGTGVAIGIVGILHIWARITTRSKENENVL